ncbi:glycosyltransferase [Seongchinamella unica]|uniref:Glycosyltransferase n=1 Tax=Seongchinamella unica TaxID=2547392 RepID=A0A4R5LQN1_9GAMM|nr:WecB/TagA/CpsF family glycosyltransferase [Seongchinamella unica]TDG12877.1 glycosyltransferase [Seongchinamella unica]
MESRLLNGVQVYAPATRQELINYALNNHSLLVAVNAEKVLHATDQTRDIINRNLGYPDGIGAVMGLKKKGLDQVIKIPGCELWLDIIRTQMKDKRFYLIGAKDEVIEETVLKLRSEFPGINIVNYRNGYLKQGERELLLADIVQKKPDVVFVAMGSPRQELLMEEMSNCHSALYQGLGGSFDLYTGRVERAPDWWLNNGLEWLYRLVKEPWRAARQIHLVRYLWQLALGKL